MRRLIIKVSVMSKKIPNLAKNRNFFYCLFYVGFLISFFSSNAIAQDSTKVRLFGIKPHLLQITPFYLAGDSFRIQLKQKKGFLKLPEHLYDIKKVMPKNQLLWDNRESSYYTPPWVRYKMAQIMNRPTPNEVLPIFPIAFIAARMALQHFEILKKITIKPEDYLIPPKYWPILKALWDKHPQTAEQLYEITEINQHRTLKILRQDLQFLVEQKLIKQRKIPNQSPEYLPAQSRGKALLLIDEALRSKRFNMQQKKKFLDLKNYLTDQG